MASVSDMVATLPEWLGLGAGGGAGFFGLKWFVEWSGGRVDKRELRVDQATQQLIENFQKRLDEVTGRLTVVEEQLAECRTQHAAAEAKVLRLEATVQGLGDARQQAAVIVAAERTMDRTVERIVKAAEGEG